MDVLTPAQRKKNMQHIKSKNTSIEVRLRKALWAQGIRYRKNYKNLPGKPDIAITKYKIAVFCDSEFFHGKDWDQLRERLSKSERGEYWISKILRNQERDRDIDQRLQFLEWKVLHFWGNDIKKDTIGCVQAIKEAIFERVSEYTSMNDEAEGIFKIDRN